MGITCATRLGKNVGQAWGQEGQERAINHYLQTNRQNTPYEVARRFTEFTRVLTTKVLRSRTNLWRKWRESWSLLNSIVYAEKTVFSQNQCRTRIGDWWSHHQQTKQNSHSKSIPSNRGKKESSSVIEPSRASNPSKIEESSWRPSIETGSLGKTKKEKHRQDCLKIWHLCLHLRSQLISLRESATHAHLGWQQNQAKSFIRPWLHGWSKYLGPQEWGSTIATTRNNCDRNIQHIQEHDFYYDPKRATNH